MQISSLKRGWSLPDLQHLKALRSNSNLTVPQKSGSPWLTLFLDDGGCVLYNPKECKIERSPRDFSGARFLANSGKWFLMVDSRSNIYIIDVLSKNRIDLPPLESLQSSTFTLSLKRVGDKEFQREFRCGSFSSLSTDDLMGRLWVDDKAGEFVVVWFFDSPANYLGFCKKGNDHYTIIPLRDEVPKLLRGLLELVLRGYRLYISTTRRYVRVIDLSGQGGFEDITESNPPQMLSSRGCTLDSSIAVTTAGEVLLVESTTFESHRSFRLYKKDPNAYPYDDTPDLLEVDSLGDEALLLDLGITVPANYTIGIKPNSIYFTRHDRSFLRPPYELDICVFNLATNHLKNFPFLANMNLKDARWFLPMT